MIRFLHTSDWQLGGEIRDLASQAKEEGAQRVLDYTEEVLQWLNSML